MGKRFECADLGAQFMITKGGDGDLSCVAADGEGSQLGKRYQCAQCGTMVLCTKPGTAQVCCDSVPMELLAPRALPASD